MGDENKVMGDGNTKSKQRLSVSDTYILPTCVTNAISPFGRLTKVLRVAVLELNTIWSGPYGQLLLYL